MRGTALIIGVLISGLLAAQQGRGFPEVTATAKGTLVLPVPVGNRIFTDITENIGALEGCVQMPFYKGLGLGLGYKANWFNIQERVLSPDITGGEIFRTTIYGKLQYEQYIGPYTFYELSVRAGSTGYRYTTNACAEPNRQQAFHMAFTSGLYLHATDNLAFGLIVGYERDQANLGPQLLCLSGYPGRTDGISPNPYQYLYVGLGFSTRFTRSDEAFRSW
jgi:hypothetical protein